MYRMRRHSLMCRLKAWGIKVFLFSVLSVFIVWITSGASAETINDLPAKEKKLSSVIEKVNESKINKKRKNIFLNNDSSKKSYFNSEKRKKDPIYLFGKMFMMLLFVLLLIGLFSFIFKKFLLKRISTSDYNKENELFSIVFTHNISPDKSILISKVFNNYFIIGVTNNNVNLISKVDPSDNFLSQQNLNQDNLNFADILDKNMQEHPNKKKKEKSKTDVRAAVRNKLQNFKEL